MHVNILLPDEKFLSAAQQLIENAEKKIWISTFKAEITTKPRGRKLHHFFDTLFEKAASGVDVRFMMNRPDGGKHVPISNEFAIRALLENKIKVRRLPHVRCCHAKLILTDYCGSILGSHNLSVKSCLGNFECSMYVLDPDIEEKLRLTYLDTWATTRKI